MKDFGGSAFPWKITVPVGSMNPFTGKEAENEEVHVQAGMSIRDYFAAKALVALLGASEYRNNPYAHAEITRQAFQVADAMIAERSKP